MDELTSLIHYRDKKFALIADTCGVQELGRSRPGPWFGLPARDNPRPPGFRAGVVGWLLYSQACILLDLIRTSHGDQAKLQAEVLALRRQVQILERQNKRVRWTPGDRMIMAALRERLQRSAWARLLVRQ